MNTAKRILDVHILESNRSGKTAEGEALSRVLAISGIQAHHYGVHTVDELASAVSMIVKHPRCLNHHRHFFGRRFGISFRGETASTACIGFGLERLIYGILSQCGLDRQRMLDNLGRFFELRARPNQLSPA